MADYPLVGLGLKIKAHWKQHRPKMYAELEKSGHLDESVHAAQEQTSDLMYELRNGPSKLPYQQAWELAREEWALLPSHQGEHRAEGDRAETTVTAVKLRERGRP